MPPPGLAAIDCATESERGKDASQGLFSLGIRGQGSSLMTKEREKLPQSPEKGKKVSLGNQVKVLIKWSKFSGAALG